MVHASTFLWASMPRYLDRGTVSLGLLCLVLLVMGSAWWRARSRAAAVVIRIPSDASTRAIARTVVAKQGSANILYAAVPPASPSPRVRVAGSIASGAGVSTPPRGAALKPARPDLPWRHPGMCAEGASVEVEEARARYLGTFVPTAAWHTTIYADPRASPQAIESVRSRLELIHEFSAAQIGLDSEPPPIYVYPSVEQLRAYSCTSKIAVSYYDGAIHLAANDATLEASLRHEYAHHVLVNGITGPMWFQEGAAMAFGGDCPSNAWQLWRGHPFDPRQMISGFPHSASLETATEFNAQACIMMEFLERLCLTLHDCGTNELANALTSGEATPDTLFNWAISRRGADLFRTTNLPLWDDYAERGDFAPPTKAVLLHRAGVGPAQP
jgi:hypothetical protein